MALYSIVYDKYKFFFVASKIRAVQIRAMENRASRGMPVFFSHILTCAI